MKRHLIAIGLLVIGLGGIWWVSERGAGSAPPPMPPPRQGGEGALPPPDAGLPSGGTVKIASSSFTAKAPTTEYGAAEYDAPTVEVLVMTFHDEPIGGALITGVGLSPCLTDEAGLGRVALTRPDIELVQAMVVAEGYAPERLWLTPGQARRTLRLQDAWVAHLHVVDEGGDAISNARILVVPEGAGPMQAPVSSVTVHTDAGGHARVTGLAHGGFEVAIAAPGFEPAQFFHSLDWPGQDHQFTLQAAQALTVRVLDPDGQPLEGAEIAAMRPGSEVADALRLAPKRTAASGMVRLEDVPQVLPRLQVEVDHPKYVPVTRFFVGDELASGAVEIHMELRRPLLRGRVCLADGTPLRGAIRAPHFVETAGSFASAWFAQVDGDGRYVLRDIVPNVDFRVQFDWEPRHSATTSGPLHVTDNLRLRPGEERTLDLRLTDHHASRLSIKDPEGRPVAGVAIEVLPAHLENRAVLRFDPNRRGANITRGWSGATGEVDLVLAAGDYRVRALLRGTLLATREFTIPSLEPHEVTVTAPLTLNGRVLTAEGTPYAHHLVQAYGQGMGTSALTDAEGHFHLIGVPGEPFHLVVEGPQGAESGLLVPKAQAGQNLPSLIMRSGHLDVTVVSKSGVPVAGATLRLEKLTDRPFATRRPKARALQRTLREPREIIEVLSVGSWRYTIAHPDGGQAHGQFEITPGATTSVRGVLPR